MKRCVLGVIGLLLAGLWACTHAGRAGTSGCCGGDGPKAQADAGKSATETTGAAAQASEQSKAPGELPASGTEKPPSAAAVAMPPKGDPVDNSRCHVCHINFADEELAVNHANAGVGCEKCHGKSDAHCGDEDNVTAPDIMYAKEDINAACTACHKALPDDHRPVVELTATKQKHCTDCHGEHKVALRSRAWDKRTGTLIVK